MGRILPTLLIQQFILWRIYMFGTNRIDLGGQIRIFEIILSLITSFNLVNVPNLPVNGIGTASRAKRTSATRRG